MIPRGRKNSGMAPIVATIILVAITITVAIAVVYAMGGVSSSIIHREVMSFRSIELDGGDKFLVTLDNRSVRIMVFQNGSLNDVVLWNRMEVTWTEGLGCMIVTKVETS